MKQLKEILTGILFCFAVINANAQSFITNGLVAYYPFNGNANDASGNGNNPTSTSAVLIADRFGVANRAMSFGTNQYIQIPASISLFGSNQFTISAWVNMRTYNGIDSYHENTIVSTVDWTGWNGGYEFDITGSGTNANNGNAIISGTFNNRNGSGYSYISGTNKWKQVVIVYSNQVSTISIDGIPLPPVFNDAAGNVANSSNPLCIGRRSGGVYNNWFLGSIDDVRIYNRALSSNDVTQLFASEAVPPAITTQPVNVTANVGSAASFSVTATGSGSLSYQWYYNGTNPVVGATNATLAFSNVQNNQAGTYSVIITNAAGSVTSRVVTLTIPGLSNGLIGYYPFNGDVTDQSGNGNNGINSGFTLTTDRFLNPNAAYSAASQTDFITTTEQQNPLNVFTLSAWFKTSADGNIVGYFGSQTAPNTSANTWDRSLLIAQDGTGRLIFYVFNGTEQNLYSVNSYNDSNWHHAVGTLSSAGMILYCDGQVVATRPSVTTAQSTSGWWRIGRTYVGSVDDVRIYNRALSSTEVAQLYASETVLTPTITAQPTNTTASVGGSATFNVTASNNGPFSYQWVKDGVNLVGGTNATLTVANVQPVNIGNYSVLITNSSGSISSSVATLTIPGVPTGVWQGLVAYYPFNGNANDASGNGNNGTVAGAVLATDRYNVNNRAYSFTGSGRTEIYIPYSPSFNSTNVTVSAWALSTINNSGAKIVARFQYGYSNPNGESWALGYGTSNNSQALISGSTYQNVFLDDATVISPTNVWTHVALTYDGQTIAVYANGQLLNTLTAGIPINIGGTSGISIGGSDQANGWWSAFTGSIDDVRIYNRALSSNDVTQLFASEAVPPAITTQPVNVTANVGSAASFSVTATGSGSLSYQWYYNGTNPVVGATNATLAISNVQTNQAGAYSVIVTNAAGSVTSTSATLTVNQLGQSITFGTLVTNQVGNAPFTLTATASSGLSVSYTSSNPSVATVVGNTVTLIGGGTTMITASQAGDSTYLPASSASQILTVTSLGNRYLKISNSSGTPGATVVVPIQLSGLGNENAFGFSITFDPTVLNTPLVSLGSGVTGAALNVNSSQATSGKLGVALALPSGQAVAAGVTVLVNVQFTIANISQATNITVGFGDTPIVREVTDALANVLSTSYQSGVMSVAVGYEADVSPRPNGSNNGTVTIADWVQVGRFVAGLDAVNVGSEFQRADCAPRSTLGDGHLTIADWVQAGRYAAGLDPVTPAGGPDGTVALAVVRPQALAKASVAQNPSGLSLLTAEGLAGQVVEVAAVLQSQGNENAFGFSLAFDTNYLTFVDVVTGTNAAGATLLVNSSQAVAGRVGVALALSAGTNFTPGLQQVLRLRFQSVTNLNGVFDLTFGDTPVLREVTDATAQVLPANYTPGVLLLSSSIVNLDSTRVFQPNISGFPLKVETLLGKSYVVELSTNLFNWTVFTNFTSTGATIEFLDNSAIAQPKCFYRVREVTP